MNKHRNWRETLTGVVVVLLVLSIGLASYAVNRSTSKDETAEIVAKYISELCKDKENKDKAECQTNAPEVIEGGGTDPVIVGPTNAQVRAQVRVLLPPMIGQSVALYCANDFCKGGDGKTWPKPKDGKNGTNGTDGKDSTVPGPEGKQGPAGPAGPAGADSTVPGPAGKDGRSITGVTCKGLTPQQFTYTYSDGTSDTFECDLLPPIEEP